MIRISNRTHSEHNLAGPQIQYVDRVQEMPVEVQVSAEPQIIEVPVERIVEKIVYRDLIIPQDAPNPDLEAKLNALEANNSHHLHGICAELEMQRRALISLKQQRDVDRSRRLQLIMRLKKQRDEQKKLNLKVKLVLGASLLISILSLIIKL